MIIVGIDPGKNGGVAIAIDNNVKTFAAPSIEKIIAELEWQAMGEEDLYVYIEKAQAMPGQGVSSMFNYGVGYGQLLGVIQALKIPHVLVHPRTWTKVMHAGTKLDEPKKRSLEAAKRLFPTHSLLATSKCRKQHDGIVDALLIMQYGRLDQRIIK